jgi:pyruvate dehydrogenase E1 component
MEECVDGEYQNFKAKGGAYTREHFFGRHPELKAMVAHLSDEDIWHLNRGGHDALKVYAAYHNAVNHKGRPTVILAKTVKGFGMGAAGEGQNITHQKKKLDVDDLKMFRDRFHIPLSDEELTKLPYFKPAEDSEELQYLKRRRQRLGGVYPIRRTKAEPPPIPDLEFFRAHLEGSGDREFSTTMAFVRILSALVRDKAIGSRVVPIVPDEARTFGMEGMFRQVGIYSSVGQLYTPQDADQLTYYKEDKQGQILEEGINEGGSYCSWLAAATAYSNHGVQMIPFYIYYSMFGFQRIGDFAWAGGDMRARGFLIGGTAGRTTLAGEGLQHQDGHSQLVATTIPNCRAYDPCFNYELAVIIQDGLRRMCKEQESIFYYISCMNENYVHPAMPSGVEAGILRGMYLLQPGGEGKVKVQLLGSGTILREVLAAAALLQEMFSIPADVWSVTSFSELRRDALDVERWNGRHPQDPPRTSYVSSCFAGREGPFVAATDYMKTVGDQIRQWVPGRYAVLGTDGFGRSDSRAALRAFFEVDRNSIVVTALRVLADDGSIDREMVSQAIAKLGIDPDKPNPLTV